MKPKNHMSVEDFIDGANYAPHMKKARKRIKNENILLHLIGRVENATKYKRVIFSIPPDLEEEVEKHCSGSKQAIYMWLVRYAIDQLKQNNQKIIEELE